jgi:uncharacterized membrane protein
MVSKERLAGFIDAIIAVVMTIMLLEFRLPQTGSILDFLKENLVYIIAYSLSFIYVTTSWFNQQYMLKHAERVTRRIYAACMLWVLSLSLLPILAAWTGRTMNLLQHFGADSPKAPALCYAAMFILWGIAYVHMSKAFMRDNPKEKAELFRRMEVFVWLSHPFYRVSGLIVLVITFFYPPFVFIDTAVEMLYAVFKSRNQSVAG